MSHARRGGLAQTAQMAQTVWTAWTVWTTNFTAWPAVWTIQTAFFTGRIRLHPHPWGTPSSRAGPATRLIRLLMVPPWTSTENSTTT